MFDIGMIEMFLIVILAIIVVGPKDLPKLLRSIGQFISKVRKMGQEFQSTIKQMADEVELEEVTKKLNEAGNIPLDDADTAPDIKPDIKPEIKSDIKPEIKPEIKSDIKPETKPESATKDQT